MTEPKLRQFFDHPRHFRENKFVYPVVSRRSRGLSIGINLNPDRICNFDCIYCQVDRRSEAEQRFVETERLVVELQALLQFIASGDLFRDPDFADVPRELRRINDIAFSGDGEPTSHRNFDELVELVAEIKRRHGLDHVKLLLITNASLFHRPPVQRGLQILDRNQGEIWAKLDAGTEAYYQLVERTAVPFSLVLDNIRAAAQQRALVIQSLFMRIREQPPATAEIEAFADRLCEILADGGQFTAVQIYTIARPPAESWVQALSDPEVDAIAEMVQARIPVPVECYYG